MRGAFCGNGIVQSGEECDDGDSINDDECTNACTLPVCGDGIAQPGNAEECDGTASSACESGSCLLDCTCEPPAIPTVSAWGLVVLTLLLLAEAKIYFARRPTATV